MTGDTSLIVVVIILAVLVFLFSGPTKKNNPQYVVMKDSRCLDKGKSYMEGASELNDVEDLSQKEDVDSDETFADYVVDNGLEKSVTESHKQYVKDLQQRTSGASVETVTSHDENINPWVGLRRPDYLSIKVDPGAREVSSQTKEQLVESSNKRRYGYF